MEEVLLGLLVVEPLMVWKLIHPSTMVQVPLQNAELQRRLKMDYLKVVEVHWEVHDLNLELLHHLLLRHV